MNLWTAPRLDLGEPLREERQDVLELLGCLGEAEWSTPTACTGWDVKDLALHLLDDDFGWLSRGRDAEVDGLVPMDLEYREFVEALNQKNQRWVDASRGLSWRLVQELLAWSGAHVSAYHDAVPLTEPARVIWAGGRVPGWLGLGRDFTERWVHQQQIRDAVGNPGDHHRFLITVLSVFVWAFRHQYRPAFDAGTIVNLNLGEGAQWDLIRGDDGWGLVPGLADWPRAAITTDRDSAWRLLTGNPMAGGSVTTSGPVELVQPLLEVRGIIV